MTYFLLTVVPALVVFFGRLPATVRRIRAQREALRPVPPVARSDHLPCMVNTIGAVLTEFSLLGLLTLAVFIGANAVLGTLGQAPDLASGIRDLSVGMLGLLMALAAITTLLLFGGTFTRAALIFSGLFTIVIAMVISTIGDQWPAVILFALFAVGIPTLLVALLSRLR